MLAASAPLSHLALGLAPRGVSLGMPSLSPLAGLLPRWHPPRGDPSPFLLYLLPALRPVAPESDARGSDPPHLLPGWPWQLLSLRDDQAPVRM